MPRLSLTPIDLLPTESLTIVRNGTQRKWKITAMILAVTCLVVMIIISVMISNRFQSYGSTNELITSTNKIETSSKNYIYTDSIINITAVTGDFIDEKEKETTVTSDYLPLNSSVFYTPFPLSNFNGLQTSFGLSLNHSIYYNINYISEVNGYVISVTLRLFTNWEGDDPLYIFALKEAGSFYRQITHRYPLVPERNNTEWQTIDIPLHKFPIFIYNHIAIGMQDRSDTNQLYAVRSTISVHGGNITNYTTNIFQRSTEGLYGAAFTYTVFQNDKAEIILPRIRR